MAEGNGRTQINKFRFISICCLTHELAFRSTGLPVLPSVMHQGFRGSRDFLHNPGRDEEVERRNKRREGSGGFFCKR